MVGLESSGFLENTPTVNFEYNAWFYVFGSMLRLAEIFTRRNGDA
jgi:hypothetical protein